MMGDAGSVRLAQERLLSCPSVSMLGAMTQRLVICALLGLSTVHLQGCGNSGGGTGKCPCSRRLESIWPNAEDSEDRPGRMLSSRRRRSTTINEEYSEFCCDSGSGGSTATNDDWWSPPTYDDPYADGRSPFDPSTWRTNPPTTPAATPAPTPATTVEVNTSTTETETTTYSR